MSGVLNNDTLKSALGRRSWLRMPSQVGLDQPPPVDIVQVAQDVLGASPVNGKTGRVQKKLQEIYQGRPASIDSARTAVRISSWNDEAEKSRLETLFHYGLCEAFNYNAAVMADQFAVQGGAVQNLEDSYKNKAILPETRPDPSLLAHDKLEIEKPGYPGEIIDLRAIASTVHLTAQSTSDRWRQLAREILDLVLPKEVQCLYSAATKASMYFPLPPSFLDGIVKCCAISSGLDEEGIISYSPSISSHVRTSLQFKLNEIKKGKSKDINELVRIAVGVGWTPPGVTREEACVMHTGETYAGFNPNDLMEDTKSEVDVASEGIAIEMRPTPTAHLKRRGPVGIRRSDRKKKANEQDYLDTATTSMLHQSTSYPNPGAPGQPDHPPTSRDDWWKEEEEEED